MARARKALDAAQRSLPLHRREHEAQGGKGMLSTTRTGQGIQEMHAVQAGERGAIRHLLITTGQVQEAGDSGHLPRLTSLFTKVAGRPRQPP